MRIIRNKSTQDSENVTCPLCGLDNIELFLQDGHFRLVRCKRCGLVYINPRPPRKKLHRKNNTSVNANEEMMDHIGYISFSHLHELKARKFLGMIKKHKNRGKLLDVGCAAGFFLNSAKHEGFEPFGVETSENLASFAKREFKLNIFCGTLREAGFPDESFEIVTMLDVLSHLSKPVDDLNEIFRILQKDGLLLIETGNKGDLNAKIITRFGDTMGSPNHLYHFGEHSLMKLLDLTGFECLSIKRYSLIPSRKVSSPTRLSRCFITMGAFW